MHVQYVHLAIVVLKLLLVKVLPAKGVPKVHPRKLFVASPPLKISLRFNKLVSKLSK